MRRQHGWTSRARTSIATAVQQVWGCNGKQATTSSTETLEGVLPPLTPMYGAAEFIELMTEIVADEAPHLVAVVQEYGERSDGRIAAWGMAVEDHVEVVSVDSAAVASLRSLERAVRGFSNHPNVTVRVVWVNPDGATPPER